MRKLLRGLALVLAVCTVLGMLACGSSAAAPENKVLAWNFANPRETGFFTSYDDMWVLWTTADGFVHRDHGYYEVNKEENAIEVFYSPKTAEGEDYHRGNYRFMPSIAGIDMLPEDYKFARAEYKAKNPAGETDGVKLQLLNNGHGTDRIVFSEDVKDTNGKYVLSDVAAVSDITNKRLDTSHMTMSFDASGADGEYFVKAVYFFKTEADAKAFQQGGATVSITEVPEPEPEPVVQEDPSTWGKPLVLNLESKGKTINKDNRLDLYFNPDFGNEDGVHEYDKEKGALRLIYDASKRADYRLSFKPKAGGELTEAYRYMRVTYMTDYDMTFPMVMVNNGTAEEVVLTKNTGEANGKWVTTQVVDISGTSFVDRFSRGAHVTLGVRHSSDGANIWIKNVVFFTSKQQAYEYFGDEPVNTVEYKNWNLTNVGQTAWYTSTSSEWTLWTDEETGTVHYDHGAYETDTANGAIKLLYSPADESGSLYKRGNYRCMPYMSTKEALNDTYTYARILYSATNSPEEKGMVSLRLENNGGWGRDYIEFEKDVQNTNGEFVLSGIGRVTQTTRTRLNEGRHMTLYFNAREEGADYRVRAIYFFSSQADAEAFTVDMTELEMTIAGTPVSEYRVVIAENAPAKIRTTAETLCAQIAMSTGAQLEIVTDAEEPVEHEIIIGNTTRPESAYYYEAEDGLYFKDRTKVAEYEYTVKGGKLLFMGASVHATRECVGNMLSAMMSESSTKDVHLEEGFRMGGRVLYSVHYDYGEPAEGVVETWSDDFNDETAGESPNFWLEHALTDYWKVTKDGDNLVYTADGDRMTFSWLHVFDRDVEYTAKMKIDEADEDAVAGMLLRFNEDEAYIRVGYDFAAKEWFIRDKEGDEYYIYLFDTAKAELPLGEWFTLKAVLNKSDLKVYLNDEEEPILSTEYLHHVTPGRVGFFTDGAVLSVDDVNYVGVSGQGKVMEGVTELAFGHRELDVLNGLQGNSIYELEDGSLVVLPLMYHSTDDGITWKPIKESLPGWGKNIGGGDLYHVLRLQSGKLLNIKKVAANNFIAQYSEDDGYTWHNGGTLVNGDYMGYGTTKWINMNDKLTQMSDGRIFMTMNGDGTIPKGEPNSHGKVFIHIYYSDDDGMTWTRSETESFDICNNSHFGESVIVEGDNGQLVWLTTWNNSPTILYSISEDNGVTWSKAQEHKDFVVSCSSSCIKLDPYAEEKTYYMVSVFNTTNANRSRLGLFRTHNGLDWEYLGDMDRWEGSWRVNSPITMYVNPSIQVTEDYIYVGSGRSEFINDADMAHHGQTQMFIRFEKDKLEAYDKWPTVS